MNEDNTPVHNYLQEIERRKAFIKTLPPYQRIMIESLDSIADTIDSLHHRHSDWDEIAVQNVMDNLSSIDDKLERIADSLEALVEIQKEKKK